MNTTTLTLIIVSCIGLGTLFLIVSATTSSKISKVVPQTLRNKWFILLALIIFFIVGYIFFLFSFLFNLNISTAFLSGIIFLAGALFVLLVVNLSKQTIFKMFDDENELRVLNKKLKNYSDTLDTKAKEQEELISKLNLALDEIKTLHGIIPICAYCKKIRNDKGAWDAIEAYIIEHTYAEEFSHGVCPDCFKKQLEKFEKDD